MEIGFTGKRALVTGAGAGMGRAIALALHKGGAETYALSLDQSELESLAQEAPGIHTVCQDVSKWPETKAAVEKIVGEGPIDLLVSNASIGVYEKVGEITKENSYRMVRTNLLGAINVAQEVAKGMMAKGEGGSIVFISSTTGLVAHEGYCVYGATQAGLDSVARVMALELGPHQIRTNCVNPTYVLTELGRREGAERPEQLAALKTKIPLGKVAEVKDVVNTTLYLLSDKADMITGSSVRLDGGHVAC